jgi:excisionase family DNA binding protein
VAAGSEETLISVKEAAIECGRNPETVRRWIWNGKLPAEKLGNQLFIRKGDLTSFRRGTGALTYKATPQPDFLERAIALQQRMKARRLDPFDEAETVRRMRDERMSQLEQSLH